MPLPYKKDPVLIKLSLKHFAFLISLFICHAGLAQHETDNWYFGNFGGISFLNGSPGTLILGQTYTVEGNATISDGAGNLLFYTNGETVWNKNNLEMANGTGLHGGFSLHNRH